MVAALECDYNRLEELRDERADLLDEADPWSASNAASEEARDEGMPEAYTCGCGIYVHPSRYSYVDTFHIPDCPFAALVEWDLKNADELAELTEAAGDCESEEDARERIAEDPLSVQVRSGWTNPGSPFEAEDFAILLCTGGPAVRIQGQLGEFNVPCSAQMEYQDWFTEWTEYLDVDEDVLLKYCRQFYFGD